MSKPPEKTGAVGFSMKVKSSALAAKEKATRRSVPRRLSARRTSRTA